MNISLVLPQSVTKKSVVLFVLSFMLLTGCGDIKIPGGGIAIGQKCNDGKNARSCVLKQQDGFCGNGSGMRRMLKNIAASRTVVVDYTVKAFHLNTLEWTNERELTLGPRQERFIGCDRTSAGSTPSQRYVYTVTGVRYSDRSAAELNNPDTSHWKLIMVSSVDEDFPTTANELKGTGRACFEQCKAYDPMCTDVYLDIPSEDTMSREVLLSGLLDVYQLLRTTDLIESAQLMEKFGMSADPCERGETTVAEMQLVNQGKNCTLDASFDATAVMIRMPGTLQAQFDRPEDTIEMIFTDDSARPELEFESEELQRRLGGQVVALIGDPKRVAVTIAGQNDDGKFLSCVSTELQ